MSRRFGFGPLFLCLQPIKIAKAHAAFSKGINLPVRREGGKKS